MKRHIVLALLIGLVLVCAPCRASFEVFVGDFVKLTDGQGSSGGIFHTDVLNRGTIPDFDTFCVELTETISFNTEYYVDAVGLTANQTGRQLSSKTAWLYTQFDLGMGGFANGLTGFNFLSPTVNMANALQLGIWSNLKKPDNSVPGWTDAEIDGLPAPWDLTYINFLRDAGHTQVGLLDDWLANYQSDVTNNLWPAAGTGGVQIMTLRKFVPASISATGPNIREIRDEHGVLVKKIELKEQAQDQLFRIPPGGGGVTPELPSFYMALTVAVSAAVFGFISSHRKRIAV